jgi:hypothetical protein
MSILATRAAAALMVSSSYGSKNKVELREMEDKVNVIKSATLNGLETIEKQLELTEKRHFTTLQVLHEVQASITRGDKSTWYCVDGDVGGGRNFPGSLIFDQVRARFTREATLGKVPVPLRGHDTFVMHAARTWNSSEELRVATSKSAAKTAANCLAARSPL